MPHPDTHRDHTGEESADPVTRSPRGRDAAQKEQASKDADAGAAPEQSDSPPKASNSEAKRPRPAQK